MEKMKQSLLDEALGLEEEEEISTSRVFLIEDCVETSGDFVLHHLMKRALSSTDRTGGGGVLLFVALAHPFSHYDRILRKLGCNLIMLRDNNRFVFFNMLKLDCPDGDGTHTIEGGAVELYGRIQKAVEISTSNGCNKGCITIMIDDISLLEIAAHGSANHILNFVHYCHTLTTEMDCSLVMLNHSDIYSSMESPGLILPLEYLADVIIKAEPLATGLATDVHGQLTVAKNGTANEHGRLSYWTRNFHFKVKENNVEYFYPGSRT
ncbi:elongator complex protein 6 [Cinnamomum micranthum f. kanehirae]|uniref:Elongator complex protein 6 n=1 Tax=Cinnamomum micranthum f. kanehirae TaxID=337451 RepID=A0A3S3NI26_9MAGN|nr:elongator complex protein 6 [Cinnamomum micranthum f. kanehirae]